MRETIVLDRTYTASIEDVWALWTTKEGFESWWGPEGFRVEVHELDARAGGAISYDMIADAAGAIAAMEAAGQPTRMTHRMTFRDVSAPSRLVITSVIDFSEVETYESDLVVELRAEGEQVHMKLTLEAMHNEEWTRMAVAGWESQLNKLSVLLSGDAARP